MRMLETNTEATLARAHVMAGDIKLKLPRVSCYIFVSTWENSSRKTQLQSEGI